MKTVSSFHSKFSTLISWTLSCFDRVLFKGHLPISRPADFERFVDRVLKVRRADFMKTLGPQWSDRLVEHSKSLAEQSTRPWEYRAGEVDKDAWAKRQLQQHPVSEGLVGVLCVMEACPTFKLAPGKERPCFVSRKVPQRVLYYYFVDVEDPTPDYDDLKNLTERQRQNGRSYAGFNPAREEEARLFAAVLAGDHVGQGFRNKDLRTALYGSSSKDPKRHRQSAAIGRTLKRLHVRGLVAKVSRTRRWRVTEKGRHLLGDTLRTYRRYQHRVA